MDHWKKKMMKASNNSWRFLWEKDFDIFASDTVNMTDYLRSDRAVANRRCFGQPPSCLIHPLTCEAVTPKLLAA